MVARGVGDDFDSSHGGALFPSATIRAENLSGFTSSTHIDGRISGLAGSSSRLTMVKQPFLKSFW